MRCVGINSKKDSIGGKEMKELTEKESIDLREEWWREILCKCEDLSPVDRGFARCRYEKPYPEPTHECCFEKCPKRLGK